MLLGYRLYNITNFIDLCNISLGCYCFLNLVTAAAALYLVYKCVTLGTSSLLSLSLKSNTKHAVANHDMCLIVRPYLLFIDAKGYKLLAKIMEF